MSREYCCTIVRVGDIEPIQGSDFLGKTLVDGVQIVVRKDEVSKGDIMFYASNETELCEGFLSVNNLFSREFYDKNANSASVGEMIAKRDALKTKSELSATMMQQSLRRSRMQSRPPADSSGAMAVSG